MSYTSYLKPRKEAIFEEGIEGIIDLANLKDVSKTKIEAHPADFFQHTYPTSDVKKVLDEINVRFSSSRESPGLFLFEGLTAGLTIPSLFSNIRALKADEKKRTKNANGRLLFGKTWNNMPAPAQNIFHGMNKTAHFDRKYTMPEKRI